MWKIEINLLKVLKLKEARLRFFGNLIEILTKYDYNKTTFSSIASDLKSFWT